VAKGKVEASIKGEFGQNGELQFRDSFSVTYPMEPCTEAICFMWVAAFENAVVSMPHVYEVTIEASDHGGFSTPCPIAGIGVSGSGNSRTTLKSHDWSGLVVGTEWDYWSCAQPAPDIRNKAKQTMQN
jgi:hypothetical protein